MTRTREPQRVAVCALDALADGAVSLVTLKRRKIALCRVGAEVFALQDACPHFGGPLSAGTVSTTRKELICPWHRFRFGLGDGCSVTNRALAAITYRVEIEDGHVFVLV